MARHLLIGDGTTSTGVEANGAIGIEKLSATGPTQLVPGDTLSDSMQIRFVQGTATRNVYSPWIYGKDVINYSGKSYSAPVAHPVAARAATTATARAGATVWRQQKVWCTHGNTQGVNTFCRCHSSCCGHSSPELPLLLPRCCCRCCC